MKLFDSLFSVMFLGEYGHEDVDGREDGDDDRGYDGFSRFRRARDGGFRDVRPSRQ